MKQVTAFEAKTHLAALLDRAARGETILITRRGELVAQIGPPREGLENARTAMEFLLSQKIRLGVPLRKAVEEGRRR